MTENTGTTHNAVNDAPLADNPYVQELFSILGDNDKDTSGLSALLGHVSDMENFVKRAESKIADMKSQLDTMKEIQDHPFKAKLKNAIRALETKVAAMKERLADLKSGIIEGCKNAVQAFKDKGITALSNLASFFKIRRGLENWKNDVDSMIRANDKTIDNIKAFSTEYHSTGRHLKNMARVVVGKKPIDTVKEAGKLSRAIAAPYRAHTFVLKKLKGSLGKTITRLEGLETATAEKKAKRVTVVKPSMLEKLDANKERVRQAKRELPTPERKQVRGVEV